MVNHTSHSAFHKPFTRLLLAYWKLSSILSNVIIRWYDNPGNAIGTSASNVMIPCERFDSIFHISAQRFRPRAHQIQETSNLNQKDNAHCMIGDINLDQPQLYNRSREAPVSNRFRYDLNALQQLLSSKTSHRPDCNSFHARWKRLSDASRENQVPFRTR